MSDIENALRRAQKLAKGLRELSEQMSGEIPEELDSYDDLQQIFDALEKLDGASEHIVEVRSELRTALVTRVERAVQDR